MMFQRVISPGEGSSKLNGDIKITFDLFCKFKPNWIGTFWIISKPLWYSFRKQVQHVNQVLFEKVPLPSSFAEGNLSIPSHCMYFPDSVRFCFSMVELPCVCVLSGYESIPRTKVGAIFWRSEAVWPQLDKVSYQRPTAAYFQHNFCRFVLVESLREQRWFVVTSRLSFEISCQYHRPL